MNAAMYIIGVYNGRAMAGDAPTFEESVATTLIILCCILLLKLLRFFDTLKEQRQRRLRQQEEERERQHLQNHLAGFAAWRNRKLAEEKIQQGEPGSVPKGENATE